MTKKVIHVNQHNIKYNHKNDANKPVITVKNYKQNIYGHEAVVRDEEGNEILRVKYSPDKPLSCGARVWIETKMPVEVLDHSSEDQPLVEIK